MTTPPKTSDSLYYQVLKVIFLFRILRESVFTASSRDGWNASLAVGCEVFVWADFLSYLGHCWAPGVASCLV